MTHLPYRGGTFVDVRIRESGRRLLADLLGRLSRAEVKAVFEYARFDEVERWADAFERRVAVIAGAGPCPEVTETVAASH
jgi:hypothetical protein